MAAPATHPLRCLPLGEGALIEVADLAAARAHYTALAAAPPRGVRELIPAARTVFARLDPALITRDAFAAACREALAAPASAAPTPGTRHTLDVIYDGEDLDPVARLLGLSREALIDAHTGGEYTVAFMGFAPGFGYLVGGDPRLNVPRRDTPRTRIPAGAVALAGTMSAVYPQVSPGGWQILGTTGAPLWEPDRERAALLAPGDTVRFRAVRERAGVSTESAQNASTFVPAVPAVFDVHDPGLLTTFQDLGRSGHASQGVAPSGAADRAAHRLANRLVGNPPDAVTLEVTSKLTLEALDHVTIAVTGAETEPRVRRPRPVRDTFALPQRAALTLEPGDLLDLSAPRTGVRAYLAARGGFAAPRVLGSASRDLLSGLGPPPLAAGDELGLAGCEVTAPSRAATPGPTLPEGNPASAPVTLDVTWGPRDDYFTPASREVFTSQSYTVTAQSNRAGLRLEAPHALDRAVTGELPSEATLRGAVQVPPSGQPIVFLADHPLTGGYPVIACIAAHHLDLAGQIPVGARVRFRADAEQTAPPHPDAETAPHARPVLEPAQPDADWSLGHRHGWRARITAQALDSGAAPTVGRVLALHAPGGPGVRTALGARAGDIINAAAPVTLIEVLVTAADAATAVRRLRRALDEVVVAGVGSTLADAREQAAALPH
ncbi:carboxyltransferase domain-containing protein [Micrococcales bacterium 31B]|nr:carboxyltransferase domain-containing protein [Micrococcales bacterium 31B]